MLDDARTWDIELSLCEKSDVAGPGSLFNAEPNRELHYGRRPQYQ